jgi:hypothetical protein
MKLGLRERRGQYPGLTEVADKSKSPIDQSARTRNVMIKSPSRHLLKKAPRAKKQKEKTLFGPIAARIAVAASFLALLTAGAAFGQNSPPQNLALNPPARNTGMADRKQDELGQTYAIVPDSGRYLAMSGNPKPKIEPGTGSTPTNYTIVGEPFCNVSFDGDNIIFKNFAFGDANQVITAQANNETKGSFQKNATVVYVKEKNAILVHNGYYLAQFLFKNDLKTNGKINCAKVGITEARVPFENGAFVSKGGSLVNVFQSENTIVYPAGAPAGYRLVGRVFTHEGAIYDDVKSGITVEATKTELFVRTTKGTYAWKIKDIIGNEVPPLEKPIISMENGWIKITDNTISDGSVKYKLLINPATCSPSEVDMKVLPEGEPVAKI